MGSPIASIRVAAVVGISMTPTIPTESPNRSGRVSAQNPATIAAALHRKDGNALFYHQKAYLEKRRVCDLATCPRSIASADDAADAGKAS
jgi:hypothetical protein